MEEAFDFQVIFHILLITYEERKYRFIYVFYYFTYFHYLLLIFNLSFSNLSFLVT